MAQPFLGEIILAGFNFAPVGYAFCDGQTLPISQNDALFALLGTTFGGDGQTTFNLPNLQSRVAIGQGQGQGLSPYVMGQVSGTETVTLTIAQLAQHTHPVDSHLLTAPPKCTSATGNQRAPGGHVPAREAAGVTAIYSSPPADVDMRVGSTTVGGTATAALVGSSQPHDNFQPTLVLNYVIALEGVFPSQN